MLIKLPIRPLSINRAFQGRRFKSKECNQYCKDVAVLLPKNQTINGYVKVHYRFYLRNWKMTDGDNLVKILQDCIVKANIIDDDRKILKYIIEKFPAEQDGIEVEIEKVESLK